MSDKPGLIGRAWVKFRHFLLYGVGYTLLTGADAVIARFSKVGNAAVFDEKHFAWRKDIETNWQVIRDELAAVMQKYSHVPNIQDIAADLSHLTTDDGWKSFFLCAYGYRSEINCAQCPETMRLVEQIPDMETAFFSFLAPGKHIPRHRGEYKGLIRSHLGLIVPEQAERCRMQVDDEMVHWEEGKLIVFDNAYHHEVWNDTDELRVILLVDVVRPMWPPFSWLNRLVVRIIGWSPYIRAARKKQRQWEADVAAALA